MIQIDCDGYHFDFQNIITDAFKFDDTYANSSYFHGLSHIMKAVDIVAEGNKFDFYIELKGCRDKKGVYRLSTSDLQNGKYDEFLKAFQVKYRDTFLYRYAEGKVTKPIVYLCLLNFDSALLLRMQEQLTKILPVGQPIKRWKTELVKGVIVVDDKHWNATLGEIAQIQFMPQL